MDGHYNILWLTIYKTAIVNYLRARGVFIMNNLYQPPAPLTGRRVESTPQKAEWIIFFKKRVLFEWFRDRWKEQTHIIISLELTLFILRRPHCYYIELCSFFTIL
jgi:hypothetical protein